MARRSVLFSPGDQPNLLEKAPGAGADTVVFDLEDAVVPGQKATARDAVADVLAGLDADCEVCVRVNPLGQGGREDIAAIAETPPDSVMLPKVDAAADIETLADALADHGLDLPVLALLETASGILAAPAVARTEATAAVLMGAEDLAADIGATRPEEGTEIPPASTPSTPSIRISRTPTDSRLTPRSLSNWGTTGRWQSIPRRCRSSTTRLRPTPRQSSGPSALSRPATPQKPRAGASSRSTAR